jgi:hypothetical protein
MRSPEQGCSLESRARCDTPTAAHMTFSTFGATQAERANLHVNARGPTVEAALHSMIRRRGFSFGKRTFSSIIFTGLMGTTTRGVSFSRRFFAIALFPPLTNSLVRDSGRSLRGRRTCFQRQPHSRQTCKRDGRTAFHRWLPRSRRPVRLTVPSSACIPVAVSLAGSSRRKRLAENCVAHF